MRRVVALLAPAALVLTMVTGCGSDDGDDNSGTVTVSGSFGTAPTVKYKGRLDRKTTEIDVLKKGDGAKLENGDYAFIHIYIGNGFRGEEAYSSYEVPEATATPSPTTAPEPAKPQFVTIGKELLAGLRKALIGQTVGSRVEVLATPKDAFGETGNPELGIGNADSVVFVVDIMGSVLDKPEGVAQPANPALPKVVEADGKVTGLDFTGVGAPAKTLEVHTLVQGEGPAVEKGDAVAMRYLGQVWKAAEKFDENYTAEGPGFPNAQTGSIEPGVIGVGNLIKGWDEGLVGVKQGSRVLLVVPAKWGYGAQGSGDKIKGGDTLAFVVDILGVG